VITALVAQSLLLASAWQLRRRLCRAAAAARSRSGDTAGGSPLAAALARILDEHADQSIAAPAAGDDLTARPVLSREPHDPYTTAAELVRFIQQQELRAADRLEQHERLLKAIYQLQDTLTLPEAALESCLEPAIARLRAARLGEAAVGAVERVRPGELVDRARMWPLSHGTRVRQPLGVVVRDTAGTILSRAKVLCR